MNLIAAWPRFMRPELAEEYVGGRTMLAKMVEQGLVKPRVQGFGLGTTSLSLLIRCLSRREATGGAGL